MQMLVSRSRTFQTEYLLSLHMTRQQISPVKGLRAACLCASEGSFRVVVEFVSSAMLGTSEDLYAEVSE